MYFTILETIIFDTIGLSPDAGRMKQLDVDMCERLEKFLNIKPNHRELFEKLWSAHNDVSHLTPKQILSKDLKIVENILVPGLPMLVKKFLCLCNVQSEIRSLYEEAMCSVIVLMGLEVTNGVVYRDIGLYPYGEGCQIVEIIDKNLMNCAELNLEVVDVEISNIKYFKQNNHKLSRKRILPLIKASIKQLC